MPLYDFKCSECDRISSWFGSHSQRPPSISCEGCGESAAYTIAVSQYQSNDAAAKLESKGFRVNDENWSGVAWHTFVCDDCGEDDLEDVNFKAGEGLEPRKCSQCGGVTKVRLEANIDRFSEQFPYFDKGLGCWLKSKAHRREVCRKRGLVPLDGDYDFDKQASNVAAKDEKNHAAWTELEDRYEHHPAFRKYRAAREKGMIDAK